MGAAKRYREQWLEEDTGGADESVQVPYEDALDDAETFTDYEAEHESLGPWVCECGTHNEATDGACHYCGRDVDGVA